MKIELAFVGYKDEIPIYSPIDVKAVKACKGQAFLDCETKKVGTRTSRQNRALHKFLAMLSEALNDAGYDMKRTLKEEAEIPWTAALAKEFLWKPMQEAMLGKESTTALETQEVSQVYETLNRYLANTKGVSVPFPDIYQLLYEEENENKKG